MNISDYHHVHQAEPAQVQIKVMQAADEQSRMAIELLERSIELRGRVFEAFA